MIKVNISKVFVLIVCFCTALTQIAPLSFADDVNRPNLVGDLDISEGKEQKSVYQVSEDEVIDLFTKLKAEIDSVGDGGSLQNLDALSRNASLHLTAVYLHCTVNRGTCKFMLDALLEVDLINSKVAENVSCPNMLQFWRLWLKSDMEERAKYLVKTTYLKKTADFNAKVRPSYVRCKSTIEKILRGAKVSSLFGARYKSDVSISDAVDETLEYLRLVHSKYKNIFIEMGIQSTSKKDKENDSPSSSQAKPLRN